MGNPFKKPKAPAPDPELQRKLAEQRAAEEEAKRQAELERQRTESKRRRGLLGTRSLFGEAGGRGYFDSAE